MITSARARPVSRFDRRKEEILNAAAVLFNRHGLRDTTLAVVAGEIGLDLKSLRYYFARREDLVAAAFMRSIDLHRDIATNALAERDLETRIGRFVRDYFDLVRSVRTGERPEFVHFGDVRALTEPQSVSVWAAYNEMFKTIRELFRRPDGHADRSERSAAAHMLLSQVLWSVVWIDDYLTQDLDRVAARFTDILFHGISTKPLALSNAGAAVAPSPDDGGLSVDAFLRTATALINRLGYRGASVNRISAELNVTKGAFYYYNETRDGLIVACFERAFALLRQAQDAALEIAGDGSMRVASASVSLVRRQMLDEGTLLRTSALTAVGPQLRERMKAEISRSTLRFGDMLNDGVHDGSVRPCNVRIAAEMITATINSAEELSRWVPGADVDNAAELYVRPLFFGLLAGARSEVAYR